MPIASLKLPIASLSQAKARHAEARHAKASEGRAKRMQVRKNTKCWMCNLVKFWRKVECKRRGRDESKRRRAESQWIVAARPLCHLQYPVAYLSRLQRILPAARWELRFKEARTACPPRGLHLRHVPLGAIGPYCGSAIGRRARASFLARILT